MRPLNLLDAVAFLRAHALRAVLWGVGFAVLGYLLSYLIPPVYQAKAVILPPDDDELTAALSLSRRSLGGIGSLSRLGAGSYFSQADIAMAMLRSRNLYERVVKQFDLQKVYHAKYPNEAIAILRDKSAVQISTDGTISISVKDRSPTRAADVANAFMSNLDELNRLFRSSRARRAREFLQVRVAETDSLLRSTESALAAYQRRHGSIVIPEEASGSTDAAARFMSEKAAAEVELELMRSYASPRSEEFQALQNRVTELRRMVGDLPTVQVGGAELVREAAIQRQVLAMLTSQLEESRIREVMDTPTIQVLDSAVPPEKRAWPRRTLIAGFGLFIGLGVGLYGASLRSASPRARA